MHRRILLALATFLLPIAAHAEKMPLPRDGSGLTSAEQATLRHNIGLGASDAVTFQALRVVTLGDPANTMTLDGTLVADGAGGDSTISGAGVYGHGIWDLTGGAVLIYNSGASALTVGSGVTWTWLGTSKVNFLNSVGLGTINGLVKFNGAGVPSQAVAGTDYAPATSGSTILKGNGSGGTQAATKGTDYPGLDSANTYTAPQTVNNATASTSTTTGAVVVTGGVGIGGDANIGGRVTMAGIDQLATNELREGRDYVYSDGATSNRAAVWTPGATGNLAGAASATWRGTVTVPTAAPSADAFVAALSDVAAPAWSRANSLTCYLSASAGVFVIRANGAVAGTDYRQLTSTTFRATYSGQTGTLEVTFTAGTTAPVVRWNDVDISSGFTASTGGTPPNWLDSGLLCTYATSGLNWPAGRAPLGCWLNGTLTAADRTYWRLHGRPPAWVTAGTQSTTPSNFTFVGAASATNFVGSAYTANSLTMTKTAGGSGAIQVSNPAILGDLGGNNFGSPERHWYYQFDVNFTSGSGSFSPQFIAAGSTAIGATISTSGTYSGVIYSDINVQLRFAFGTSVSGDAFTADISNFKLIPIGAITLPIVQPVQVLDDATGNGIDGLLTPGMTPVTPRKRFRIIGRTATNGNQQLLGGALFADYTNVRIVDWSYRNNGAATRTVSLGSVSGGTQYGSGLSMPVGNSESASFAHFLQSNNIWVSSNGTDELVQLIFGEILSK